MLFCACHAGVQCSTEPQPPAASARGSTLVPPGGAPQALHVLLQPLMEALGSAAASLPQEQEALREREAAPPRHAQGSLLLQGPGESWVDEDDVWDRGYSPPSVLESASSLLTPPWPSLGTSTGAGTGSGFEFGAPAGAGAQRGGGAARRAASAVLVINEILWGASGHTVCVWTSQPLCHPVTLSQALPHAPFQDSRVGSEWEGGAGRDKSVACWACEECREGLPDFLPLAEAPGAGVGHGDWTGWDGAGASWPLWFLGAAHALPSWGCSALGVPPAGEFRAQGEGQVQGETAGLRGEGEGEGESRGEGEGEGRVAGKCATWQSFSATAHAVCEHWVSGQRNTSAGPEMGLRRSTESVLAAVQGEYCTLAGQLGRHIPGGPVPAWLAAGAAAGSASELRKADPASVLLHQVRRC